MNWIFGSARSVAQSCLTIVTPWTVAHQASFSMGFPRREYWRGLPFPPSGDLPNPGIEPTSPVSLALAVVLFTTSAATWEAQKKSNVSKYTDGYEKHHTESKCWLTQTPIYPFWYLWFIINSRMYIYFSLYWLLLENQFPISRFPTQAQGSG